jgi:hypothetical protein
MATAARRARPRRKAPRDRPPDPTPDSPDDTILHLREAFTRRLAGRDPIAYLALFNIISRWTSLAMDYNADVASGLFELLRHPSHIDAVALRISEGYKTKYKQAYRALVDSAEQLAGTAPEEM